MTSTLEVPKWCLGASLVVYARHCLTNCFCSADVQRRNTVGWRRAQKISYIRRTWSGCKLAAHTQTHQFGLDRHGRSQGGELIHEFTAPSAQRVLSARSVLQAPGYAVHAPYTWHRLFITGFGFQLLCSGNTNFVFDMYHACNKDMILLEMVFCGRYQHRDQCKDLVWRHTSSFIFSQDWQSLSQPSARD